MSDVLHYHKKWKRKEKQLSYKFKTKKNFVIYIVDIEIFYNIILIIIISKFNKILYQGNIT